MPPTVGRAGEVDAVDEQDVAVGQVADGIGGGGDAQLFEEDGDGVVGVDAAAVVDVVGADHRTGEFLEEIGFLVGTAGRLEKSEGVGAVAVADLREASGEVTEGVVPGDFAQAGGASQERLAQALGPSGHLVHVPPPDEIRPALVGCDMLGQTHEALPRGLEVETAPHPAEGAGGQRVRHGNQSGPDDGEVDGSGANSRRSRVTVRTISGSAAARGGERRVPMVHGLFT